jgi:hypothetical protein
MTPEQQRIAIAAKVLQIMREQWMADIQSKKIREQEDRIKRLEAAGDAMEPWCSNCQITSNWNKAKEAKL